jgi:hypothetical protein
MCSFSRHRYHKDDVKLVLWSQEGRKRVLSKLAAKLMVDDDKVDQFSAISVSSSESERESPCKSPRRRRSRSVDSRRRSHRSRTRSRSRRARSRRSRSRRTRSRSRRRHRHHSLSSSSSHRTRTPPPRARSRTRSTRSPDHSVNIAHSTVYNMAQSPDRQGSFQYSHSTNVAYHYY